MLQSRRDNLSRRRHQVVAKISEKHHLLRQIIDAPDLAIVGSFHGINTGDQTLGLSVQNLIDRSEFTCGLQNIFSLRNYPKSKYTICAGGATGVESVITELACRNFNSPAFTALVGINFSDDVAKFSEPALTFLQQVSHLSCRSKREALKLAKILQREDILYTPDNAFAYDFSGGDRHTNRDPHAKVLGFNVLNLFMTWVRGKGFIPGTPLADWYRKNNSPIVSYLDRIGPAYIEYLNRVISIYSDRGWEIVHVPFTPEDDLFAKTFCRSAKIKYHSFSPNPNRIFAIIQTCNLFISTRFHALVFAAIAQVPCIPINYAHKCHDLLTDLNIGNRVGVDRYDLVDALAESIAKTVDPQPLILDESALSNLKNQSTTNIERALNSLLTDRSISNITASTRVYRNPILLGSY
jgi:polysaccharide pyruvyl transferase WcaK-like protein